MSTKERKDPRMSMNKLGEYLVASPARRRKIIEDQKRPPDFQTARYREAEAVIASYLMEGDPTILTKGITALQRKTPRTPHEQSRIANSIEALQKFDAMRDAIEYIEDYNRWPGSRTGQAIQVAGMDINVRPEVFFRGVDRKGKEFVGAIKLHLSKTFSHGEDSAAYAATLMHEFLESQVADDDKALHKHSILLDVFTQTVYRAPQSNVRRKRDIQAACEEIVARWPSI